MSNEPWEFDGDFEEAQKLSDQWAWAAQDANGGWHVYEQEPTLTDDGDYTNTVPTPWKFVGTGPLLPLKHRKVKL